MTGVSPLIHFAVGVEDVDATTDRGVEHGGIVTQPPTTLTLPGLDGDLDRCVRFSFLRGPDGESVELIDRDAWHDAPASTFASRCMT
jgi:hypothetical protein